MAALKRYRGTWVLILLLATGFFLLREKRSIAAPSLAQLVINAPIVFQSNPPNFLTDLDNGPNDSNLTPGIFEYCGDVLITHAGEIKCDDVTNTAASGCPITLVIQGNLVIQAGGKIHSDNLGSGGGGGGPITIDVGGVPASGGPAFKMCGPLSPGPLLDCDGPINLPGALISSRQLGGGNGEGGDILIRVGGVTTTPVVDPDIPVIGVCESRLICGVNIPANTGSALIDGPDTVTPQLPATITTDAASGRAGDIALYTGKDITVNGTVRARGFQGAGHGGAITLDACCNLLIGDTGVVSSQGQDPGPNRVHLEACKVTVYGLVQSTGPGHEDPEPNCTPPERPGKPINSTGCVEIWAGTTLTISSVPPHMAEVNADVGFSGGTTGLGWIDILANGNIVLQDGTGDNFINPLIPGPNTDFMVHANMNGGLTNSFGGLIAVTSKAGSVSALGSTVGDLLQANANSAAGGNGGSVTVLAGGTPAPNGNVILDIAKIQALGALDANGACGKIFIKSFTNDAAADITGTGSLAADGDTVCAPTPVVLEACIPVITYSGSETPSFTNTGNICPGGQPLFPAPADTLLPPATCEQDCQQITPTPTPTATQTPITATPTPTPFCKEDPGAHLTRSVKNPGSGVPNYDTVQAAYDAAAANAGEQIGMFGNTVENVTLGDHDAIDGDKTLKITQCTSARITAADNTKPVWNITSTGKLTIQGPDSVGGTIGWLVANASGGPHTLKSVRANGASVWGIRINSSGNNVSWNDVSGNGPPGGILVVGNSNILKGGTTGHNTGDGVKITGNSNTLSGATVESNTINGVNVTGGSNQIKSNKASLNGTGVTGDGFKNAGGASNKYSGNSSNTGGKENHGAEYSFVTAGVDGGSNRADGINVPKLSLPTKCTDFAQANTVCE